MAIKKGDVVTLKSGSVDMTVNAIQENRLDNRVHCVWFINNDENKEAWFDIEALELSDDTE